MKWGQKAGPVLEFLLVLIVLFLIVCFFLFRLVASTSADDRINLRLATRTARRLAAPKPAVTLLCEVSAYSPTAEECSGNPFITASGKRVYVGGIAADPRVLPLGSRVIVPNYNNGKACTVVDTGSYIKGNRLDVFFFSTDKAIHWGRRRNVKVQVLYVPRAAK